MVRIKVYLAKYPFHMFCLVCLTIVPFFCTFYFFLRFCFLCSVSRPYAFILDQEQQSLQESRQAAKGGGCQRADVGRQGTCSRPRPCTF